MWIHWLIILKDLLQIGITDRLSPLDVRRVHLLNTLIVISTVLSVSLLIFDVTFELWHHLVANLIAIFFVFLPSLTFNHLGKYNLARRYFIINTSLVITVISALSISNYMLIGMENMLLGFAVAAVILFDGRYKKTFFLLIYTEIFFLLYLRHEFWNEVSFEELGLSMVYYTVTLILIFLFVDFFRKEFTSAYEKIVNLNVQLAHQTEKVRDTQAVYFDMIDNIPLFLSMMDSKGRYTAMNTKFSEKLGFRVNDITGLHYREVLPETILSKHFHKIEESLRGNPFDFSEELTFPDGDSFHAFGSYMPIKNAAGEVVGVTHFLTDISDLKQKEKELEKLNETKNRLFSVIAHDLRKPLNLLNGFLFISQQEDATEEEQRFSLDQIDKQMKGLREMMDNLLLWARNQISGGPPMVRSHNIKELVNQEIRVYAPMIESKKLKLYDRIPEDINLTVDDMFLRMVVRNVYTNAIKYTPAKGSIELSAIEDSESVTIQVKDSGLGMPEEIVNRILSGKFVHSMEGTQGEKGSGIGLYLGIEMLRESGGDIQISSNEGDGTTFRIILSRHNQLSSVA